VTLDSGLDLHVELSPTRPARSLESRLRNAIVDGRLPRGTRLPPARSLAADLAISRNTVAAVYAQLNAEGWLQSRVGAGTWVSDLAAEHRQAQPPSTRATSRQSIDLRGGIPDPSGFPRRDWLAAVRAATLGAGTSELGYPDPAGTAKLRAAVSSYVARTRGVAARPDSVVVGQGFGELLALVCRALVARGARRVAVEEYGHSTHRRVVAAAGLKLVPITVDDDGADVEQLESLSVDAVLLTPAHQFPLGTPLSARRRRQLTSWADRNVAWILEDDYDGEFRYDRRAIGALQALAPDRVIYVGTASKAVAPSAGLGWAVPPAAILPDILEQRELAGGQPAALHQLALAALIDAHGYDRSVRRLRSLYRSRRTRLENCVASQLPDCELTGLSAGLQCILRLPPDTNEKHIERSAAERGLRLEGLAAFRVPGVTGSAPPAVVIGYGGPTPGQFDTALAILVECVREAIVTQHQGGRIDGSV
jgi:GntR family transcriptional regulator/MocR family aminotransferase